MKIDIGINEQDRKQIADSLGRLLADSYTLYLKTHNFHWNVTGPQFATLHAMFEQEYTELAQAVDEIAERIRALGFPAPASYAAFGELSTIREETGVPKAMEMVRQLAEDQHKILATARAALPPAEKAGDQPTIDLVTRRMQTHEKTAWMLRTMVE